MHISEYQNFTTEFKRTMKVVVLNMFSADGQVSAGGCRCLVSGCATKCFNELIVYALGKLRSTQRIYLGSINSALKTVVKYDG